jgi:chaperonin GroES
MKLAPMFNNVVVQRDEAGGKTEGGIILPDSAKEKPKRGTIVTAGLGKWQDGKFVETILKPGDKVLFSAYAGSEVEMDGKTLLIMADTEILAVITK